MGQQTVLERKNEILKRRINGLVIRENVDGLSNHEQMMMQKFLREYHGNCYQMNTENNED